MIIFHIDVNSAFLSWTSVHNLETGEGPDLRQVPAVIGGDESKRHGIVLAKSESAKRAGIHTADTLASARAACPGLLIFPPDHRMYRAFSRKLMDYLRTITPLLEKASIDECYLDYTALLEQGCSDPDVHARRAFLVRAADDIRREVRERFGFTVNVGISDRKVLAKTASDFSKPDRTHTLFCDEIQAKFWPLPIGELFMAGRSSAGKLRLMGIETIGDLARSDPALIEAQLKSHGRLLWEYANGIDTSCVEPVPPEAKGVGASTTVARDVETAHQAYEVLHQLAAETGRRLRAEGKRAANVCVEIKYADFHRTTHQAMLRDAIEADADIYREACRLFDADWSGAPARLLGIRLTKLSDPTDPVQLSIFDMMRPEYRAEQEQERARRAQEREEKRLREERESEKRRRREEQARTQKMRMEKLDRALEKVRLRYGERAVLRGADATGTDAVETDAAGPEPTRQDGQENAGEQGGANERQRSI